VVKAKGEGVDEGLERVDTGKQVVRKVELVAPVRLSALGASVAVEPVGRRRDEFAILFRQRFVQTYPCNRPCTQDSRQSRLDHFEGGSRTGLHRHVLMTTVANAFRQSRRFTAAGRKKNRGTAATTEHTGDQASHPGPFRTASAEAMPAL
jgi:hypothetical protein